MTNDPAGLKTETSPPYAAMSPSFPRVLPAPGDGGFRMEGYWIWCGSVVFSEEDRRYHMFASRWPKTYAFHPHWLFNCEIVRASSDTPEGPYRFEEVVLPRRRGGMFDGMNTHNPSIKFFDGVYYLYYFGATYSGEAPPPGEKIPHERYVEAWNNKRVGLATSRSVFGPWERRETPLLLPRPGKWDCTATTNPSAAILPDGTTYMIYKSRAGDAATLKLGITRAPHPSGPYERLIDDPVFKFPDPSWHVEDPFLWYDAETRLFNVIYKDDFKSTPPFQPGHGLTGEWGAGVHAQSEDCIHWEIQGKAYERLIRFRDGTEFVPANMERANLLIRDGKPTHLFNAIGVGPQPWTFEDSYCSCIPLESRARHDPEA